MPVKSCSLKEEARVPPILQRYCNNPLLKPQGFAIMLTAKHFCFNKCNDFEPGSDGMKSIAL